MTKEGEHKYLIFLSEWVTDMFLNLLFYISIVQFIYFIVLNAK